MDASFERFQKRAREARTAADMYLAATELAASVRCGHTWTNVLNQQGAIKQRLLEAPDKLPLTMTLAEGRSLVLASAAPGIAAGDEVLAIDGHAGAQVVAGPRRTCAPMAAAMASACASLAMTAPTTA